MKRWRWLGLAVLAASLTYLVSFAWRHVRELPELSWNAEALASFLSAIGLYELALLTGALAWHLLLRSSVPGRPRLRTTLGIHLLSHAAKYLPGNVGQYVGRAALARQEGLDLGGVLFTLVAETACAVIAAVVFAAALLDPGVDRLGPGRLAAVLLAAALAAILGGRLARSPRLRRLARLSPAPGPKTPGPAVWLACLGLSWLSFSLLGGCALLLLDGFFGLPAPLPALAGLFAAAWVAGFVTPGAPAGLGIREAVLVAGLDPLFGPQVALALPLLFRLLTVIGDGAAFLLGAVLRWYATRAQAV
jgi:hypothetical protein